MKTHFCLLLLILFSACSIENSESDDSYNYTLQKVSEYEIEIDSTVSSAITHYQYYTEGSKEYFTFLNKPTQEIIFYNLATKTLAKKVALNFQGQNSVGNLRGFNSGFYIHSFDSIFVLNRSQVRLYLLNSKSEVINEYDLDKGNLPSAVIAPFAPLIVHQDTALLLNFQSSINYFKENKKYRSDYATIVDLKTSTKSYFLSYPDVFNEEAWGLDLHRIGWTYNRKEEVIVVNYSIDNNIQIFDTQGKWIGEYEAKGDFIEKPKSITKKQASTDKGRQEYYYSQGKYYQVYFDPTNDIYLRNYSTGIPILKQRENNYKSLKKSMVIISSKFEKLGELDASAISNHVVFFNSQGLNYMELPENENILKFKVYKVLPLT